MRFEWDRRKDAANFRKHGVRFEEAKQIFAGPVLTRVDDRDDYGELREISLGRLSPGTALVVVHTERDEITRIISARKANDRERRIYDDYFQRAFAGDDGDS